MKLIKRLLLSVATLVAALVVGAVSASIYRHLKYPHVPVEETDVSFDIGLVFFLGFIAVVVAALLAWVAQCRKHGVATATEV